MKNILNFFITFYNQIFNLIFKYFIKLFNYTIRSAHLALAELEIVTLNNYKNEKDKLDCLKVLTSNIKYFINVLAPLISYGLIKYAKPSTKNINVSLNDKPLIESIICLFSKNNFKTNNRYLSSSSSNSNKFNFNHNRYKWYGFLHLILLMILSEILTFKSILIFYIIIAITYLLYLLLDLFIFILYLNKKMTTTSYLPDYIRNWLIEREEKSLFEGEILRSFLDLYIRDILVCIFSLLFIISLYILL